jgi:hypothetical protein
VISSSWTRIFGNHPLGRKLINMPSRLSGGDCGPTRTEEDAPVTHPRLQRLPGPCLRINPGLALRVWFRLFEFQACLACDGRRAEGWTSRKFTLGVSALVSIAFEEWAATMCIARENGILAVQMGHISKPDRGVCSFTPIESISTTASIGKQFNRLLAKDAPRRPTARLSENLPPQVGSGRTLKTWLARCLCCCGTSAFYRPCRA